MLLRSRTDDQLVELYRAGTEEAFAVIHDRYRPRLRAYARQIVGESGDIEDMLQDVFLIACRALRTEQGPDSLRVWLHRLVQARCASRAGQGSATSTRAAGALQRRALPRDAETQQPNRQLDSYLRLLTEQQRSALLLREMDGMSYSEISETLGISVPGVRSLLTRARIGLTEAVAARDADCAEIRDHLIDAYERRVRAGRHARHHMRECETCAGFQRRLLAVRRSLAAVSPGPALSFPIAKLFGLGGAGSGAAAGGGTAALAGGGTTFGVSQIAAIVCCATAVTGGAIAANVVRSSGQALDAKTIRSGGDPALRSDVYANVGSLRSADTDRPRRRTAAVVADRKEAPTERPPIDVTSPVGNPQRGDAPTEVPAANAATDAPPVSEVGHEAVGADSILSTADISEIGDAVGSTAVQDVGSITRQTLDATTIMATVISNAAGDTTATLGEPSAASLVDTALSALPR